MGGGAWPFLVGEVTCQVNSDNGRDLGLLNRTVVYVRLVLLRGTMRVDLKEVRAYNRFVMPLDDLGCTCATMVKTESLPNSKE